MAFDGAVVACITDELNQTLKDCRIAKVAQPEKDSLLLTLKKEKKQYRLLISVNPSLPMLYLTEDTLPSPQTAFSFCMLLRKHLAGGQILSFTQPSLERIIDFTIEHYNEMGDLCKKHLIVELMGKHSNIILTEEGRILDSIKHISAMVSSVREVLPGRDYFIPFEGQKLNPLTVCRQTFCERIFSENSGSLPAAKALYMNVTGFSPALSEEILYRAGVDSDRAVSSFSEEEKDRIFDSFLSVTAYIRDHRFCPFIAYRNNEPVFYAPFAYKSYADLEAESFSSISALLHTYYAKKQAYTSIRQKTADLRQLVNSLLHKDYKKYDLQLKQMKDTEKKEKNRLYGELLMTYGYSAEPKATCLDVTDYYSGKEVRIPLDPSLSAIENAKKYYEKYSKQKRTAAALESVIRQTEEEIEHLESVSAALDIVKDQDDIAELRKEMEEAGYLKARINHSYKKEKPRKGTPLHYLSSDGYDMYVGKNNFQNEFLSFKLAEGNDWWFHAKKLPGSHVIVKTKGQEIPDTTFEEAARLAAHYSGAMRTAGTDGRVEVDYVQKKKLKKTPGGKPGFVIYHTNYSMSVSTDISDLKEVPF